MRPRARLALLVSGALLLAAPSPWTAPAWAATRKAPGQKKAAARKKPASKKKKVVGLDLPPLPRGRRCYRAGSEVPEPALVKNAPIEVPDKARGGPLRSALLVYEVTVDKGGHISEVNTLGAQSKDPPWPQLHDAAIEALRKYKYARTVVRGKPAPVCLMVSLNLDLR